MSVMRTPPSRAVLRRLTPVSRLSRELAFGMRHVWRAGYRISVRVRESSATARGAAEFTALHSSTFENVRH